MRVGLLISGDLGLETDVLELRKNDDLGFSIGLEDDSNLFLWNVMFEGPEGTLYEVRGG